MILFPSLSPYSVRTASFRDDEVNWVSCQRAFYFFAKVTTLFESIIVTAYCKLTLLFIHSFAIMPFIQDYVRCLRDGEAVSVSGTHLGHNIPDANGNRYCINLVSVAGQPEEE